MDPDSSAHIVILVGLLLVYAFFAAAKEAIISIRRPRRLQLLEEGHYAAVIINRLADDSTRLLTTEQLILKLIGFSVVAFAAFVYTIPLAQALSIDYFWAVLLIIVVTALITLVFGELIPKEIGRTYAEPIAFWAAPPFHLLSFLAAPLAQFVTVIGRFLTGRWDDEGPHGFNAITEEDLRTYVDAGEEEGVLREDEKEMIYSIFDLGDTVAREVMVPRIDMIAVEAKTPIMEALDVILGVGHSRVPVYVDNIDNIVGILYAKDLLSHWRDGGAAKSVYDLARDVYFVPETKPLSELLRELQTRKVHIAIVVDEYGGTAGLVTIEDVLEEIVGDIQDEYDPEEFWLQQISEEEYIFSARMDLDDINDLMSSELPTDEADTLGGLVFNVLGRVPEVGDSVVVAGLRLTVLDVEGRRIGRVRTQRVKGKARGAEHQNQPVSVDQKASGLVNKTSHKPVSGSP